MCDPSKMRDVSKWIATLLAAAALAAGLSACGGGSTSTASTPTGDEATAPSTSAAPKQASKPEGAGSSKPSGASAGGGGGGSSAGGAAAFETHGGDNSIQRFGGEAASSELAQAAAALHGYLAARAAGAWGAACSYMAAGFAKSLQQFAGAAKQGKGKSAGCPQLLAALSAGVPAAARREATVAEVGALRVEGERAFLLFTGSHGAHYFMPMAREGGVWKVGALAASALP